MYQVYSLILYVARVLRISRVLIDVINSVTLVVESLKCLSATVFLVTNRNCIRKFAILLSNYEFMLML